MHAYMHVCVCALAHEYATTKSYILLQCVAACCSCFDLARVCARVHTRASMPDYEIVHSVCFSSSCWWVLLNNSAGAAYLPVLMILRVERAGSRVALGVCVLAEVVEMAERVASALRESSTCHIYVCMHICMYIYIYI